MNLTTRQQWLALVAIAAIALLVGDKVVFAPLAKLWKDRAQRITDLKRIVERGSLTLEREASIRARWESMRTNTLSPEVSVAESQALSAFDRWSQVSGIGISSIKPQWRHTPGLAYATLECRVDTFGNLSAMSRFLYEIESSLLALKIDTVELTSRDDRGEQLTLGLQISGLQLNPTPVP